MNNRVKLWLRTVALMLHLICVALSGAAQAAVNENDALGTWKLSLNPGDGESESTLTITRAESDLKGEFVRGERKFKVTSIRFQDGRLTFSTESQRDGQPSKATFDGKVEADTIKGDASWEYNGQSGSFPFTGTREPKKASPEASPSPSGRAANTSSAAADPLALVDKAVRALGGAEKMAQVKVATWKEKGTRTFQGNEIPLDAEILVQGTDHIRREWELDLGGMKVGGMAVVTGEGAWSKIMDNVEELAGEKLADERRRVYLTVIPITVLPLKSEGYRLATIADEQVGERPAAGLKVTPPDGKEFRLYFDKETGLPVRLVAKVLDQGGECTEETTYSDYKAFDGVQKATSISIKQNGAKVSDVQIGVFKVLDRADAKAFQKLSSSQPAGVPAGNQAQATIPKLRPITDPKVAAAGQDSKPDSQSEPKAKLYDPSQDTLFQEPYVDTDEWRDSPVRHRYVHGGFKGTDARFSIYFPVKEQYEGRFFQHNTPVPIDEKLGAGGDVGFSLSSGAYFLISNQGGMASLAKDSTLAAYRVNAAAAQYSRVLAQEMYGPHRVFGYAFGASGGAFRTIGGFENTSGIWDGVVPIVVGSPMAIPNVYTVRLLALRVLKNQFPAILDAVRPGGSGDIYHALNQEERDVLREATRMGFPLQGWFNYETIGLGALPVLFESIVSADPKYFEEFWTLPGYAGANPSDSLSKARIQHRTKLKRVITKQELNSSSAEGKTSDSAAIADTAWKQLQGAPAAFQVETVPKGDLGLAKIIVKTGAASGASFPLGKVAGDTVSVGLTMADMMGGTATNLESLKLMKPGDELQIDNSDFLAVQYYHRHQVPTPDFYVWDQFRGPDGKAIYPQRPKLIGPGFSASAGGTTQSGKFQGKMIVVESLWDQDAFPWQADWYAAKVRAALGSHIESNFRLWFTDRATHGGVVFGRASAETVSYIGVVQQALRDLSAWVENGIAPPPSTSYKVVEGQVLLPATASERKGIQPVVILQADGAARADAKTESPVTLSATIQLPPNSGRIVAAEWDFEGEGKFQRVEQLGDADLSNERLTITTNHVFSKTGVYFPTLRATSQRQGDATTPYARVQNLGRVRVVVK